MKSIMSACNNNNNNNNNYYYYYYYYYVSIVTLIVLRTDFAMVAKLENVKTTKKAELRQALRTKVNSIKFNVKKPGYFVGKIHIIAAFYVTGIVAIN